MLNPVGFLFFSFLDPLFFTAQCLLDQNENEFVTEQV